MDLWPLCLFEAPHSDPIVEEPVLFVGPRSRERETGMGKGVNVPYKNRLPMTYLLSTRTALLNPGTGPRQRKSFRVCATVFQLEQTHKNFKISVWLFSPSVL